MAAIVVNISISEDVSHFAAIARNAIMAFGKEAKPLPPRTCVVKDAVFWETNACCTVLPSPEILRWLADYIEQASGATKQCG